MKNTLIIKSVYNHDEALLGHTLIWLLDGKYGRKNIANNDRSLSRIEAISSDFKESEIVRGRN